MAIRVKLAVVLAERQMMLKELEEKTGIATNNLSVLKTGKAKAIRFSTLDQICQALNCQPGELLEFVPGKHEESEDEGEN